MAHYLIAQLNGGAYGENQIVSPAGMAALHSAGAQMSPSSSYGMGWVIHNQGGLTKIEHNGDTSNFHSNMLLLPEEQIGIVALSNIGGATNAAAINIPIEAAHVLS
jgi:CubicO group peptidase (beta-lactamase class C family)